MPNLYGNTDDGTCSVTAQSSWANARDHSGSSVLTTSSVSSAALGVSRSASRGGGSVYAVYRAFMYFDTSGITGTVSSATIKIYGASENDGSAIAVKSTAFGGDGGTALAATDFNNIVGFSAGSSLAGLATDYSAAITTTGYSITGYNDFTGTADLRAAMQNNNVVIICLMDYTNDYLNSALTSNGFLNYGVYFTDNSGTSKDPYIEYTLAGYGNDVNGVASGNIGAVKGVSVANIEKIIGV